MRTAHFHQGDDYLIDEIDHQRRLVTVCPKPRWMGPYSLLEGRHLTRAKVESCSAPEQALASRSIDSPATAARCTYGATAREHNRKPVKLWRHTDLLLHRHKVCGRESGTLGGRLARLTLGLHPDLPAVSVA